MRKFSFNSTFTVPIGVIIVLSSLIVLFQNTIFHIQKIEITGNEYLNSQVIKDIVKKYDGNLISIDKTEIKKEILKNVFIAEAYIGYKLLHTLTIKLKVHSLVGKVSGNNNIYIDKKGQLLSSNYEIKKIKIPIIQLNIGKNNKNLAILTKKLDILKIAKPKFFSNISKIDLLNNKQTCIFTSTENKKFCFKKMPLLEDFLKIQLIEESNTHGRYFIINGSTLIVK